MSTSSFVSTETEIKTKNHIACNVRPNNENNAHTHTHTHAHANTHTPIDNNLMSVSTTLPRYFYLQHTPHVSERACAAPIGMTPTNGHDRRDRRTDGRTSCHHVTYSTLQCRFTTFMDNGCTSPFGPKLVSGLSRKYIKRFERNMSSSTLMKCGLVGFRQRRQSQMSGQE